MATPALRDFELPGAPGAAPVRGEIRAAGGARPAVVLCGAEPSLADRLARAGFAAVRIADAAALPAVLEALRAGDLGPMPPAMGALAVGPSAAAGLVRVAAGGVPLRALATWGAVPPAEVPVPWLRIEEPLDDQAAHERIVAWFGRFLT